MEKPLDFGNRTQLHTFVCEVTRTGSTRALQLTDNLVVLDLSRPRETLFFLIDVESPFTVSSQQSHTVEHGKCSCCCVKVTQENAQAQHGKRIQLLNVCIVSAAGFATIAADTPDVTAAAGETRTTCTGAPSSLPGLLINPNSCQTNFSSASTSAPPLPLHLLPTSHVDNTCSRYSLTPPPQSKKDKINHGKCVTAPQRPD